MQPTLGVFHGEAKSALSVAVQVIPSNAPIPEEPPLSAADQVILLEQVEQQQQQ